MHSPDKDYYMPRCRWFLASYTYTGLCTHFSINEGYKHDKPEEYFTRDEINSLARERKAAQSRKYITNKGEGVPAANTKAYGDKALEEQRFECKPCGLTFRSRGKQLEHEARDIHKRKVSGIKTVPKGRPTKAFWCHTCNWKAPCSSRLKIHLEGNRHAKKLRDLELKSRRRA